MTARIHLNEPMANELDRILREEVERMLIARKTMIEENGREAFSVHNHNVAIRRVKEIQSQLARGLRARGWGDFADLGRADAAAAQEGAAA